MDNLYKMTDPIVIAKEARDWLIRLDGDDALSVNEQAALRAWGERSEMHRQELTRITQFWNEASVLTELSIPIQNEAQRQNESESEQKAQSKQKKPAIGLVAWLNGFRGLRYGGALSLVGVLGILVFSFNVYNNALNTSTNGIYTTGIGELQTHTLADGSVIRINTNSQVKVNFNADARSIRLLRGEAHFEVSHNRRWPFDVYAGIGRVKAVGTAFSVRLDVDSVEVIVSEGRVELAVPTSVINDSSSALSGPAMLRSIGRLDKNQIAQFNNQVDAVEQSGAGASSLPINKLEVGTLADVELGRQLAWREGFLVFNAQPLSQVVAEVSRYTALNITILDEELNALRIGGRFKIGEMDAMFDVFENNFGITVSRIDDKTIQLKK